MTRATPPNIRYSRSKYSTRLPTDRLYTAAHSWLKKEDGEVWRIGFTNFALRMLGEAVEMDFEVAPKDPIEKGSVIGWIEGFKAVTDIYAPMTGCFQGTNAALLEDLELLRRDPYGQGWMYSMEGEPDSSCVDAQGYAAVLDATIDKMMGVRDPLPSADSLNPPAPLSP